MPISLSDSANCDPVLGCAFAYSIQSDDLTAFIDLETVGIYPDDDRLILLAVGQTRVNSAGVPATLNYTGELAFINFAGTCDAWVRSIDASVLGIIELELVDDPNGQDFDGDGIVDTNRLEATVTSINWTWDAVPDDIRLSGCTDLNNLLSVLNFFGINLRQIVLDEVTTQVNTIISGLPAQIEPIIEDAFSQLIISEQLDLLGTPLSLSMWPETLELTDLGMRTGLGTVLDTPADSCVEKYQIFGSEQTPGSPPTIKHDIVSPLPDPSAVALFDDDVFNHALYAAWSSGLLCIDLSDPDSDIALPFPLDTNLLDLLAGAEAWQGLFDEPQPLDVFTDPRQPPVAKLDQNNDIAVVIDPTRHGVHDRDRRSARPRPQRGSVHGHRGGSALRRDHGRSSRSMLRPHQTTSSPSSRTTNSPPIARSVSSPLSARSSMRQRAPLLAGLVGPRIPIPSVEGIGVTEAVAAPTGLTEDHLGLFTTLGPVTYAPPAGCESEGCATGCSATNLPSSVLLFGVPLLIGFVRRRQ